MNFFRRKNADPRLPLSGSAYILHLDFKRSGGTGLVVRMTRDAHDGGDSPKKMTKGPKSGLKKENE